MASSPLAGLGKAAATAETIVADIVAGTDPVLEAAKSIAANFSYSSHPIMNFKIGPYQFEKGLLQFEDTAEVTAAEAAAAFEKLLGTLPIYESSKIVKLDVAAAEQFVARKLRPGATSQFDSSTGERAGDTADLGPRIGTGDLAAQLMATLDGKTDGKSPGN